MVNRIVRWKIDRVGSGDVGDCQALFRSVFASDISPSLWEWKYGHGRGRSILARDQQGVLIAHYGATIRRIHLFGEPTRALQSCDVMVRKQDRGLLTRSGVFFQTAREFQERFLNDLGMFPLAFGFPQFRAMRLPVLLGLYREVDRVNVLFWEPMRHADFLAPRVFMLNDNGTILALVNRLWGKLVVQLDSYIAISRDADYIRYRYLNHPEVSYRFLLVKKPWTRRLLGLVVIRLDEGKIQLMDILGDLRDIPEVIRGLRCAMVELGGNVMTGWVATSQLPYFQGSGEVLQDIDVRIPDHAWTPGLPIENLRERWWISLGDTDFA